MKRATSDIRQIPDKVYFRIGEVSDLVGVDPHVLRYWETEFATVRPYRGKSKQRLYRRQDVENLLLIKTLLHDTKQQIRAGYKFYSQDLINNLFLHPYTKIDFLKADLGVTRLTAANYLDALVADGILEKRKVGRSNYYVNTRLYAILTGEGMTENRP